MVLASTTPIFAFLITWGITRHEPATLLKLVGAILGLAGTAAIIGLDALGGLGGDVFAEIVILVATLSFACATISDCGCPITTRWWWRRAHCCSAASVASGVADRRSSLDLASDGGSAGRDRRDGDFLERARADTILYVPDPARHAGHRRARLCSQSDGVGLSVVLSAKACRQISRSDWVLVMAGVAAITIPGDRYRKWINRLRGRS